MSEQEKMAHDLEIRLGRAVGQHIPTLKEFAQEQLTIAANRRLARANRSAPLFVSRAAAWARDARPEGSKGANGSFHSHEVHAPPPCAEIASSFHSQLGGGSFYDALEQLPGACPSPAVPDAASGASDCRGRLHR
eukprot:3938967-Rhodomonas_salina.3